MSAEEAFLVGLGDEMKDSAPRWCRAPGCFRLPLSFGEAGGDKVACAEHAEDLVRLTGSRACTIRGCTTRGPVGVRGTRFRFCKTHADDLRARAGPDFRLTNRDRKTCVHDGCDVVATFNGYKFCKKHVPEGTPVARRPQSRKTCVHEGCDVVATFNGYQFCRKHVPANEPVSSVRRRRRRRTCAHEGCEIVPTFDGWRFCYDHAPHGVYSNTRKVCGVDGCARAPRWGVPGGSVTRCGEHREEGYELGRWYRCVEAGCQVSRSLGDPSLSGVTHCILHAPAGFVRKHQEGKQERKRKRKRCDADGCGSTPRFGVPGGPVTRCGEHREEGQELARYLRCLGAGCHLTRSLGDPTLDGVTHCARHAPDNFVYKYGSKKGRRKGGGS